MQCLVGKVRPHCSDTQTVAKGRNILHGFRKGAGTAFSTFDADRPRLAMLPVRHSLRRVERQQGALPMSVSALPRW